jgi:group II intron reverse transcriptase/maturase
VQAYELVKANAGAAGVDQETLEDFARDLKGNLYKLWNRMSSGSYMPPAVRGFPIPKKTGGKRLLGIPTVGDRICQMVVKLVFEPGVETIFLPDSYGYRPNKSALDAVGITRQRCWKYDYVLEFDIKGLFDNIPHELLMKAVRKHTQEAWILLYIERWLRAPMQMKDGSETERTRGLPQGGVISPVLSNLFLHYVLDMWMARNHGDKPWCRYADDGLVHCKTEKQAEQLLVELKARFEECGLELHSDKTKIVYCRGSRSNKKKVNTNRMFVFLGCTFRARTCSTKNTEEKKLFTAFTPAVSKASIKAMRAKIKKHKLRIRTELSLEDIAKWYNPILRGWQNYYGRYRKTAMNVVWNYFNETLVAWARKKYKMLGKDRAKASRLMKRIARNQPNLFVHWQAGMITWF